MAEQTYYIGNRGPYYYDDEETYLDGIEDLDDPGVPLVQKSFLTPGSIRIGTPPTSDKEAVRLIDLTGGIGNVTIPAGFQLIFKGVSPTPDATVVYTAGMLVFFIGTTVVGRFRLAS